MAQIGIKVNELSVDELRALISETVRDTMEDLIEDFLALSSEEYLSSIQEARKDYKKGRVKKLDELF